MDIFILHNRIEMACVALIASIFIDVLIGFSFRLLKKSSPAAPLFDVAIQPIAIFLIDRLNRVNRSPFSLAIRGFVVFSILFCLVFAVLYLSRMLGTYTYSDAILLIFLLSPVLPLILALGVSKKKPKKGAYRHASQALNRNLVKVDSFGHKRNGIEILTLSLMEWIACPLIFYMIAGIGGAYIYATLSIFCRIVGKAENSHAFTSIFYYIWRALRFIPQIIVNLLTIFASLFIPRGNPLRSIKGLSKGIWSVYAYALNVTLGGAYQDRHGQTIKRPWIGPEHSTAKLERHHILKGVYLYGISTLFIIFILVLIAVR